MSRGGIADMSDTPSTTPVVNITGNLTALDHVAPGVGRPIEGRRAAGSGCAPCPLVGALGDRVRDLARPQQLPTAGIAVALVRDEPVGPRAGASPPTKAGNADALKHGGQLGAVMALSWSNDDGQGPPFAIAGEVELGGQSAPAAPEYLVGRMLDSLFTSAQLGRCRAPLVWSWARAVELSMLTSQVTSQVTSPTASERVCACARIRSQVPSRRQR
jgi:hypothetical protein